MRILNTSMSVCVALACGLSYRTSHAEWRNALQPLGEPARSVKVVEAGKPLWAIQCSPRPTGPEKKAAADLQQWIREITGSTLEIVSGDTKVNSIAIRTDPSLGDEGYRIAVDNGNRCNAGVIFGEDDDLGHLWLYFPRIQARELRAATQPAAAAGGAG